MASTKKGSGLSQIIGSINQATSTDFQFLLDQARNAGGETPFQPGTRYVMQNGQMVAYDKPGIVTRDGKTRDYYGEDDVYATYAISPSARQTMLKRLVAANFLDARDIGDFNAEIRGITTWLNFANTLGIDKNWALDDRLSSGSMIGRGGAGGGGAVRTYQTSNTQDLVNAAKAVAQNTIGREISDEEARQFASLYQQQEVSSQKRSMGGGTVEQPMSLESAAQTFAQNVAPDEAAGYGYLGYMNKLFGMIGAG